MHGYGVRVMQLFSHRACGCPGEMAKHAKERMRVVFDNGKVLLSRVERFPERYPDAVDSVGCSFVQILHANMCLMLASHARKSATPAAVELARRLLLVLLAPAPFFRFLIMTCSVSIPASSACNGLTHSHGWPLQACVRLKRAV